MSREIQLTVKARVDEQSSKRCATTPIKEACPFVTICLHCSLFETKTGDTTRLKLDKLNRPHRCAQCLRAERKES